MFDLTYYKPQSDKKIIFRCNGQGYGGLGDRLIGLCSSFVLSLILNFEFRIYWTYPVYLEKLFDEKKIKWNSTDYDINDIFCLGHELNLIDFNVFENKNILETNVFQNISHTISIVSNKAFYLYLMKNKLLETRLKQLNITNPEQVIYNCMSILFSLKPDTQSKYNHLLYNFSKYYTIGLQIRSFIGEFFDNLDTNKLQSYYKYIEDNYEEYKDNLLIFLCTDSPEIVKHITEKYSYIKFAITGDDIIHLERSTNINNNIKNNLKLVLEIYALGKTKQLMITKSSNFGRLGSLISMKQPYINGEETYELVSLSDILSKD
jgi:hypothetical protein